MHEDPYKVLGVAKTATQDEIRKAYRKLAKKLHPDLHPGDASKQAEFQAVTAAHDIIGDPEKRKRFDAGEIDASGQERPERQYYQQYADTGAGRRYDQAGPGGYEDLSDLFSDLFGNRQQGGGRRTYQEFDARGADMRYHLEVDFLDAARGARRSLSLPDGSAIEMTIPAGLKDGQTLRLKGKGGAGMGRGPAGDALVTVNVRPHPSFARDGDDIEVELPITFDEAVLGGKVEVPTIGDPVSMTIPAGVSSGHRLRLKGKGIKPAKGPAGDQLVRLKIVLPEKMDDEMAEIARRWRAHVRHDPRKPQRRSK
ncbi:DnaJ C-terminal domain-containing protein [Seohaeicola zhoushanensis]|uniref:Molecular chaperone DnaJ n=1 Tax=Seohaeicola zhoushanensis TaxID=1569283 RepID=A0A8J3M9U9_9RHOB|nr:J domain-containing protein [Seohaeicola zhoushanensis]GHF51851.1 molecular chaperone DnaJ [Seohaeicola zhoushanensis]